MLEEYIQELKQCVIDAERELPTEDRMDDRMLKCLLDALESKCTSIYTDYVIGKREYYAITETEYYEAWDDATSEYVSEVLCGLSEQGLIQTSAADDGTLLYSLTDEGKMLQQKIKDDESE